MIKQAAMALILALSFDQAMAATSTYYYEIENRRKPHHGWKFHLLGTLHTIPIAYLPEPIQKHINNHKFVMTEKGWHGSGINRKPSIIDNTNVGQWLSQGYLRYGSRYFSDYLTPDQQAQLKKIVRFAYPELVDGGYMYQGRWLTLDDFNVRGLDALYYSGGCRQGMDSYIEDLTKDGKALDEICKTTNMQSTIFNPHHRRTFKDILNDDIAHTPLNHPYIKPYFTGTNESMVTAEELTDPIICDRNFAWLPHILSEKSLYKPLTWRLTPPILSWEREENKRYTMPPLVAVGCAHLFGETGLLRLLQKQGYRIKRARVDGVFEPYMEAEGGQPLLTLGQRKVLDQVIRNYRGKLALSKRRRLKTLVLKGDSMTPYDRIAIDPMIAKMKYGRNKQALVKALRGVADAYPVVKKKTVRKKQ